jgi:uncharacterized protein (TIGR04141 family)
METYTIFLLKDTVVNAAAALDPDKHTTQHALANGFPLPGTLFLGDQNANPPAWVAKLNPHLVQPIGNLITANVSAVLIVEYDQRLFALSFGHGRNLLRPTAWVRDFGLKATLNRVNAAKIRSMDSKVHEDLIVTTRRQTSKSSSVSSFELDVGRALLRGVVGDVDGNPAFVRLAGSDSLKVTGGLHFDELDDLLEEVMDAYEDTTYQQAFGWFDNIRQTDPANVDALDDLLVASLNDLQNPTDAYLAPSEIVDWNDIHGFNYTYGNSGVTYDDLSIQQYLPLARARNNNHVGVETLKRNRVKIRTNQDGEWIDQWSVYDCIVWETQFNNRTYVLFDGRWFEIEAAFAARVNQYVNGLIENTMAFPNAAAGQKEGPYNEQVAEDLVDIFACMDLVRFRPTGGATDIEFCDLLSAVGQLIHVKKRSSSATLSHLFSQGSVSTELFLEDAPLRNRIRARLQQFGYLAFVDLIPVNRPLPSDYEIVYAVIARQGQHGWPPRLPFFSAVNLMHHASRIRQRGFHVSLQYIRQN